jgi:hypothetical protein
MTTLAERTAAALAAAVAGPAVTISGTSSLAVTVTVAASDPDSHAAILARTCCFLRDSAQLNARITAGGAPGERDRIEVTAGPPPRVPAPEVARAFLEKRSRVPGLVTSVTVDAFRAYWTEGDASPDNAGGH